MRRGPWSQAAYQKEATTIIFKFKKNIGIFEAENRAYTDSSQAGGAIEIKPT